MGHRSSDKLFVYGTLRVPEIVRLVLGKKLVGRQARLLGFRSCFVRDSLYPGIVEAPGGVVDGVVYEDITPAMWCALDRYEGEMYERRPVSITYADGHREHVAVYLVKSFHRDALEDRDWDYEQFLAHHRETYVKALIASGEL